VKEDKRTVTLPKHPITLLRALISSTHRYNSPVQLLNIVVSSRAEAAIAAAVASEAEGYMYGAVKGVSAIYHSSEVSTERRWPEGDKPLDLQRPYNPARSADRIPSTGRS
jgi:hypothetical protein